MTFDTLGELNWLAVIVAAIAYFVLGSIWYAPPVLGRAWIESSGIQMPEGQRPSPAIYLSPLLTCFVAAVATGMLVVGTRSNELTEGIQLGVVLGVGYALSITILGGIFETGKPKPMVSALISGGYHLVGLLITAMIIAAWD
ncbi:MAG: DUF1761 domain-containing protein [Actinomycetota bacterium]|jgi:hypothetical protein